MSSQVETGFWLRVAAAQWGALPPHLHSAAEGREVLPTAGGVVAPSSLAPSEGGPAWSDPELMEELRATHVRMGADAATLDSLVALSDGAPCVVTGQQPGLLGGPLYTAWKVAGALALADELGRRWQRRVVPVFWCASDDSDFDEVSQAWWATPGTAPVRVHLAQAEHRDGQMVGGLDAAVVARREAEVLGVSDWPSAVRDWGEYFGARLLERFSGRGLVILDARSPRLRRRGRDLFLDYAQRAEAIESRLDERATELQERGWPPALSGRARQSGLFVVEDGSRRRWETGQSIGDGDALSPSVVLRALWQDRELAPVAVVLGPGEMSYHAQLTPLYDEFGVRPPATLPRPHGVLLPPSLTDASLERFLTEIVASPERSRRALLECGADPELDRRWSRARSESLRAVESWSEELGGERAEVGRRLHRRMEREWDRARRALHARGSRDWREELAWLWPQSRAQERALAHAVLDRFYPVGEEFWAPFERGYVDSLERGIWYAAAYTSGDHP